MILYFMLSLSHPSHPIFSLSCPILSPNSSLSPTLSPISPSTYAPLPSHLILSIPLSFPTLSLALQSLQLSPLLYLLFPHSLPLFASSPVSILLYSPLYLHYLPHSLILHYLPSLSSLIINHSLSLPFLPITLLSPFTIPHSHLPFYLFTLLIFYISLFSLSLHSFPSLYILSTLFCLSPLTLSTSLSPSICSPSTPSFSLTSPTLSLSPSPHSTSPLLSPFSPLILLSSLFTCTLSPLPLFSLPYISPLFPLTLHPLSTFTISPTLSLFPILSFALHLLSLPYISSLNQSPSPYSTSLSHTFPPHSPSPLSSLSIL